MALSKPNKIQILDENLDVIENTVEILNQHDIDINGKYIIHVAIVGATGSGKSFLWNKLFDSEFDEKTPEQSSRVTIGGWLHYCRVNNYKLYTLSIFPIQRFFIYYFITEIFLFCYYIIYYINKAKYNEINSLF